MNLKPVQEISTFRIPGFLRLTKVTTAPYLDARRGLLVGEHLQSVSWMIERWGVLALVCAIVGAFAIV